MWGPERVAASVWMEPPHSDPGQSHSPASPLDEARLAKKTGVCKGAEDSGATHSEVSFPSPLQPPQAGVRRLQQEFQHLRHRLRKVEVW